MSVWRTQRQYRLMQRVHDWHKSCCFLSRAAQHPGLEDGHCCHRLPMQFKVRLCLAAATSQL